MKILVAGDVKGNFDQLFRRVEAVHKKAGPFDFLLCIGSFFSDARDGAQNAASKEYLSGVRTAPIPTYFITTNTCDLEIPEEGGKVAENIFFLGKHGVISLNGLHVGYVSGAFDTFVQSAGIDSITAYTPRSLSQVCAAASESEFGRVVDILLTAEWPKGVLENLIPAVGFEGGSEPIRKLVSSLQPRYHFAATEDVFLQRAPYKNSEMPWPTFFTGLASLSDSTAKHKKWLHAMQISPYSSSAEPPYCPDLTESPFLIRAKRPREESLDNPSNRPKRDPVCWFCIDKVRPEARHLIVSHGEFTYLALPRGPLVDRHVLILPMQHFCCTVELHEAAQREVDMYISALSQYYASKGEFLVMYERNIHFPRPPCHLNLQVVPIPKNLDVNDLRSCLLEKSNAAGIQFFNLEDKELLGGEYFMFQIVEEKWVYYQKRNKRFDMSFGRTVLAQLLRKEEATDWRVCVKTMEEETREAQEFKREFAEFDWTVAMRKRKEGEQKEVAGKGNETTAGGDKGRSEPN
eukprot:NODE_1064_length_1728_cov_45.419297_g940_i0.p1 GENE.NODE_1064_length_1728_cov_45.419297_g940_i0~~NODE_1064_length_1728_cov_45.419297_g940_i0.p1  ORF type:complete len:519 (+),score=72.85 NODE_1064_length_1728_cov_45.419297_g940_i0:80-1636(+)